MMKFSLSGTGTPAQVKEKFVEQKTEAQNGLTKQGKEAVEGVTGVLLDYLDRQHSKSTVLLSVTVDVDVKAPKKS
jgi:hypothetical protein